MAAFDGIDPVQADAIRRALKKELRQEVANELRSEIQRKVEQDVREDTRQEVLQELAERAPTPLERARFVDYVDEVRLDAYAQATLASDIADRADGELQRLRRRTGPLLTAMFVALPPALFLGSKLLTGLLSALATAAALALVLLYLAVLVSSARRSRAFQRKQETHRKLASQFMIVAERAKAYAMVHAERLTTSAELHEVLEDLRRTKERQDRDFHPSARELEEARAVVRPRIASDNRRRIGSDEADDELDHEPPRQTTSRRFRL